jgi:hypothetical protein
LHRRRQRTPRIDERLVGVDHAVAGESDRTKLDDRVALSIEAGGLEVEGYVVGGQFAAIVARGGWLAGQR